MDVNSLVLVFWFILVASPVQVCSLRQRCDLLLLGEEPVAAAPALAEVVEVACERAVRLHVLVARVAVVVPTQAAHGAPVGAGQHDLCKGVFARFSYHFVVSIFYLLKKNLFHNIADKC